MAHPWENNSEREVAWEGEPGMRVPSDLCPQQWTGWPVPSASQETHAAPGGKDSGHAGAWYATAGCVDYVAYALWVKWVLRREVRVKLARGPSTHGGLLWGGVLNSHEAGPGAGGGVEPGVVGWKSSPSTCPPGVL